MIDQLRGELAQAEQESQRGLQKLRREKESILQTFVEVLRSLKLEFLAFKSDVSSVLETVQE